VLDQPADVQQASQRPPCADEVAIDIGAVARDDDVEVFLVCEREGGEVDSASPWDPSDQSMMPVTLSPSTKTCVICHVGHYRGGDNRHYMVEREEAGAARFVGGDGGESNSPSRTLLRRPLRACPMIYRRPPERASAPCRAVQSRAPRSGLTPDYVTLVRIAAPLHDASTTREAEAASTLTLLPKQRERESTGGCQVLLFAT